MTAVEKIGVVIEAQLDTTSFQKSSNQIQKYARDTKKELDPELFLKLELNIATLQAQLANAKKILANAKKSGDQDLILKTQIDTNRLQVGLTEAKRQLNNFVNTGDKDLSRLQAKFNQVGEEIKKSSFDFKGLGDTLVGAGVIAGVNSLANGVITLAGNLQQARIAFSTIIGSASEAEVLLKDLANFAKNTPFELTGLREQAKLLLAYGFNASEIIPTLESLGNISAGVGVDKLPRLTYALGQVRAAGKLTGQDFRQFTETGVSLGEELEKITGKTNINSATVSDLGITYEQVQQALQNLGGESGKFGGLMEAQSKTLQGAFSNLKDNLNILGEQIGTLFIPILTSITKGINSIVEGFSNLSKTSPTLATAISVVAGALGVLVIGLGGYLALTPFLTAANLALLASFSALLGPIALVIGGITALAIAYDNNLLGFRDFANGIVTEGKVILEFFRLLGSEVGSVLSEASSIFRGFIDTIKGQIGGLSISQGPFSVFFKNLRDIVIDNVFPIINIINNMLQLLGKIPGVSSLVGKARANVAQQNAVSLGITSPAKYNPFAVAKTQSVSPGVTGGASSRGGGGGKSKAQEEQEKLKKAEEERFKMIQDKGKKAFDGLNDSIKKSGDEVTKLQDKLKGVTDELAGIDQSIANRILTIEESLRTAQGEERLKLEEELALAKANIDEATLKTARDEAAKSETQKLLDKKTKLQEEMIAIQEKIDYELQAQKDLNDAKMRLEEMLTDKYKVELQKREDALAQSVNRQIALITNIPSLNGTSGTTSKINNTKNININANINNSSDADSLFRKISQ